MGTTTQLSFYHWWIYLLWQQSGFIHKSRNQTSWKVYVAQGSRGISTIFHSSLILFSIEIPTDWGKKKMLILYFYDDFFLGEYFYFSIFSDF